jgi:hypothetical protein
MGPAKAKVAKNLTAGVKKHVVKSSGHGKEINGITKPKIHGKVNNRQGMTPDKSISNFLSKAKAKVPSTKHGPGLKEGIQSGPRGLSTKMAKGAHGAHKDFAKDKHGLHGASKKARTTRHFGHALLHNNMFEGGKGKGSEK